MSSDNTVTNEADGPDTSNYAENFLGKYTINSQSLIKNCPLDYGRHELPEPTTGLGDLDRIPIELQQKVLLHVDLETLLKFRQVNRNAIQVVDSILEWQKVMAGAPDTVRMAVGLITASTFTLAQLFDKLCQRKCDKCGELAPYLDMCLVERQCYHDYFGSCANTCERIQPMTLAQINKSRFASLDQVMHLPKFLAIRGQYGLVAMNSRERPLYYYASAQDLAKFPDRPRLGHQQRLQLVISLLTELRDQPCGPFLALIVAPWLNRSDMTAESAWICKICKICNEVSSVLRGRTKAPVQIYTKDGLKEHEEKEHKDKGHVEKDQ